MAVQKDGRKCASDSFNSDSGRKGVASLEVSSPILNRPAYATRTAMPASSHFLSPIDLTRHCADFINILTIGHVTGVRLSSRDLSMGKNLRIDVRYWDVMDGDPNRPPVPNGS